MREFSKKFTKANEMDMKKIPKPRMEEFERRQQREREKHKRQQAQTVDSEVTLFPEPRRVNPSEGDDDITAKLGDHSKAIAFMNLNSVGIYGNALQLPNNAVGMPSSASSSSSSGVNAFSNAPPSSSNSLSSQRLLPHHYQQSRQLSYVKQADNKPSYNGRGGYPGQPVKNDARSSSGMAPPKGPPALPPSSQFPPVVATATSSSSASSSALLPPPLTTTMPNGHLGPPSLTAPTHNGRFPKPSIPKKPVPRVDSALENILNTVNQTYRAPQEITKIAATPHTTIGEYNLNGPNQHKYTFDPIAPLGSPPSGADLLQSTPITPLTHPPVSSGAAGANSIGATVGSAIGRATETTQSTLLSLAPPITAAASLVARPSKEPLKPLTTEKVTPTLEKQNSTLLNDLELSESDDDRRKVSRSMHNSSDSSQSDSSESGSEESSKSEHQQAHQSTHQSQPQPSQPQQQPLLHSHHSHHGSVSAQQVQPPISVASRSTPNSLAKTFTTKLKGNDSCRAGIFLNSAALGSAGSSSSGPSSTSSCNKTPSPSDSNKWNLSRYFNKAATQQSQNEAPVNSLVVNSMNVSMNEPTMLPGGAQIIPEPTPQQLAAAQPNTSIVKNEKNLSVQSDDEDDEFCDEGVNGASTGGNQFRHPALLQDIKKESDPMFSKAAAAVNSQTQGSGHQVPMLNDSEFVAIPTSQIKPEPYSDKRSPIIPPRTRADAIASNEGNKKSTTSEEFVRVERLSAPSSDSNSSDAEETSATTVPTLGPGGTLKIPGVPAAITALPHSSTAQPPPPTLPNAITVLPIDPQPPRRRQHKKQKPAAVRQRLDTSDEEEEVTTTTAYKTGQGITVSPAALRAVTAPGGKLYVDAVTAAPTIATKKGPGRPRKLQSGSTGGTVSSNTPAATAKGPTLTAKKEVSGSAVGAKKATARRRVSTVAGSTSGKVGSAAVQNQPPLLPQQVQQQLQAVGTRVTYDAAVDSSSSSSSSCSSSKSSSSSMSESSDAESGDGGSVSHSSSEDFDDEPEAAIKASQERLTVHPAGAVAATIPAIPSSTGRRIVQLNKPKAALDDLTQPKLPTKVLADEDDDDDDEDSSSGSSSDESSVALTENRPRSPAAAPTRTIPGLVKSSSGVAATGGGGGSSQRSQNQQSPLKSNAVSMPCSSGSSSSTSSSSSDGEHSDSELKSRGKTSSVSVKRRRRDKPKASDKNKKDTLTRIFNPKEGGAKKQGQVLVIDQSGDQNDHQHPPQPQQQKLISPNMAFRRTGSQENLATAIAAGVTAGMAHSAQSSPRLTPGHLRSPRTLPAQLVAAAHRTPDRCSSAERKLQQRIKTPTRTPTRTPPNTRTPTPTPAPGSTIQQQHLPPTTVTALPAPSLVCKIDLSRLRHVPSEWRKNSYRLFEHTPTSVHHHVAVGPPLTERRIGSNTNTPNQYDHETILNADLQAGRLGASGSGSGTPRSTDSGTTTPQAGERDHARHRLNYSHSNGRMSSRSADGGSTPKELAPPHLTPNGYTTARSLPINRGGSSSPKSTKLIAGLKHEHIKNEPDLEGSAGALPLANPVYCNDTKFKASTTAVKQELHVKPDLKPVSDLSYATEKQLDGSPLPVATGEAKPRRKRSSSSSSSPYKEKKRKKEKLSKDGASAGVAAAAINAIPLGAPPKYKEKETSGKAATDGAGNGVMNHLGMFAGNKRPMDKEISLLENHQLPPTNHDRLLGKESAMTPDLLQHHTQHLQQLQQAHLISTSNTNAAMSAHMQQTSNKTNAIMPPPTGGDSCGVNVGALASQQQPPPPSTDTTTQAPTQLKYYSYFERDDDVPNDLYSKNSKFLQEAISRKHAADKEQNPFKQVILYLEAVVHFLLSAAAMEYHRSSEDASWTMYKDTLALIKFISSKFKHMNVPSSANELHEPHNKVAVLSLRCQSLISLKLYKMKRHHCRSLINLCSEFFKSSRGEIINGNTPSSNSPSNSVCSQGSGSNTPPCKMLRQDKTQKQDIHSALNQENQYFNYLASCHELWDQADRLVRLGNHTDFFISLDHENGPLTLHSSMYEVFRYVQAGLKKLKGTTSATNTTTATTTTNTNSNTLH